MRRETLPRLLAYLLGSASLVYGLHNQYISNQQRRREEFELSTLRSYHSNVANGLNKAGPAARADSRAPVLDINGNEIPPYDTIYFFDQLIDHKNPSLGTFKQRYYHSWEYYRPGGPIILLTPGEMQLDTPGRESFLMNITIPGAITQSVNGAAVILEHRFFGESNPYPSLDTQTFKTLHTLEQAIEDFAYFARTAELQMPGGDGEGVRPHRTPWIFVGGSYTGALAAWIPEQKPNEFWAAYSTSGVVQPQLDFPQYYDPIEKYMPANCSADLHRIINYVDSILDSGNQALISNLLSEFSLDGLGPTDLAYALTFLLDWQSLNIASTGSSQFYQFCDSMEVQGGKVAGKKGWGLHLALKGLTEYVSGPTGFWAKYCDGVSLHDCLAMDGSVVARSTTINNWYKSWTWIVCNEVGWWQTGPSSGGGLVSKHFNVEAGAKYCVDAFPGAFSDPSVAAYQARVDGASEKYRGWKTSAPRVFVVNGKRDPWLDVTLSASSLLKEGPGAVLNDTETRPIYLTDGFHVSDVRYSNAVLDDTISSVWEEALDIFPRWASDFEPSTDPK